MGLAILDADAGDWRKEMQPSFWSPAYGRKLPATSLVYSTQTQTPSTICFLLVTLEKAVAGTGSFIRLNHPEQDSSVSAYGFTRETEEHRFYFAEAGKVWQFGAMSSNAEFVCFSKTGPNMKGKLILVNGSYARVGENLELRCKRPVAWAEVTWADGQVEFRSSDPQALDQDLLPVVRGDLVF
jgi:hypothetical protein